MAFEIPGLATLYAILKRNVDRQNDVLAQRKKLADELMNNCHTWAQVLLDTFDDAVDRWEREGREAATNEIMELEGDFMKLDYWSLKSTSPILVFLREDERFAQFADTCAEFYHSALGVKRLVYGEIQDHPGHYVSERQVGIKKMVDLWRAEVERMLENVTMHHMKVKVITPS